MDARGPRIVILTGVALMSSGMFLAPYIQRPWHFYATLGVLVGGGAKMMTYTAHSQFLPNWFVQRRALAISMAFAGAGVGAIVLLPWLQSIILAQGWGASCFAIGLMELLVIAPLSLLVWKRPEDIGLLPDGTSAQPVSAGARQAHRAQGMVAHRRGAQGRAPSPRQPLPGSALALLSPDAGARRFG